MYLLLLGPPIDVFSRLLEHHYPHKAYGPGVKYRGDMEYRKSIINQVTPFWKYGSGDDFRECVDNILAAHHRASSVEENLAQQKKGKAQKWDSNNVPNDSFINQNVCRGKILRYPHLPQTPPPHHDRHHHRRQVWHQHQHLHRETQKYMFHLHHQHQHLLLEGWGMTKKPQ
jgi:hypothetical protein